jgi:hypothetical protein
MFTNRNYLRTRVKKRVGKRFLPGNYLYTTPESDNGMPPIGSTKDINFRQVVSDNPNFVGYLNRYSWASLEPGRGVYDFSKIIADFDTSDADDKYMMVWIGDRVFNNSGPFPGPSYMNPASPNFDSAYSGAFFHPEGKPEDTKFNIANPIAVDRFIDMLDAMGEAISNHPRLAMITLAETSIIGIEDLPGYTGQIELDQRKRIISAADRAFPNILLDQVVNWGNGMDDSQLDELMERLVETHNGAFGATDIIEKHPTTGVIRSALDNKFGGYYESYRGVAPIVMQAQSPTFQVHSAEYQYNHAVNDLGAHFIVWQPNNLWNDAIYSIYDVIDVVNSVNGQTNTTIPSSILG